MRLPVRVVDRGPTSCQVRSLPGAIALTASGLGYAGAREEDQAHWIAAFRRFCDGLTGPLQVVMSFRPGSGTAAPPSGRLPPAQARRTADLEYAAWLRSQVSAQQREVTLVTSAAGADSAHTLISDLGLASHAANTAPERLLGREEPQAFVDEDGWHRTWYLHRYPGGELSPGWLLRLVPPGESIDLTWHASTVPTAWMVEFLQRQLASMRARVLAGDPEDVVVDGALAATEELQRRLAASQERAFRVAVYLTLTAASKPDLERGAARIEEAARSALCRLEPLTFEMAAGRRATLPTGIDPLERSRILDTSSLCTLFPWIEGDLNQSMGIVVGTAVATGMPVLVDPFDQRRYANANIGVFGHSGAGKTHLMSTLALGALSTGVQVFVLDPEHEYGALAKAIGGTEIRLALGSGHALNVLDGARASDEAAGTAIADAVDLVAIVCGDLDEAERADVEVAVRAAFAEEEQPVLRDVAARLRAGRAATVLGRWVDGALGRMFSAPTNVDLEAPIVIFGMRELREEMIAPVHFLLAEALWTRIKARTRRRLLVVDELGLLFDDPIMRRFVVTLARRIRKYDGSLLFATQNPADLLSTDAGAVVATNPAVHFFGATRPGEASRLQAAFSLSAEQKAFIESARRGEFLLSAGATRLPVHVKSPPWQAELMASTRARPPPLPRILRSGPGHAAGDPRPRPARGCVAGQPRHDRADLGADPPHERRGHPLRHLAPPGRCLRDGVRAGAGPADREAARRRSEDRHHRDPIEEGRPRRDRPDLRAPDRRSAASVDRPERLPIVGRLRRAAAPRGPPVLLDGRPCRRRGPRPGGRRPLRPPLDDPLRG